jgi:hypothetical protein
MRERGEVIEPTGSGVRGMFGELDKGGRDVGPGCEKTYPELNWLLQRAKSHIH